MKYIGIAAIILISGFLARAYNLNFPSIGYHNMMENEHLIVAQEMLRTNDLLSRRLYFQDAFAQNYAPGLLLPLPLVSYQILLAWKLLGENLWAPRLINILFGVLSILVLYLIAQQLFNKRNLSLFCALQLAIMPLAVFFSRNLQPESPGFFFMLLGSLFYLYFARSKKSHALLLGGVFICVSWAYRPNFLIGLLPCVFCFPLRDIVRKNGPLLKHLFFFCLPFLSLLVLVSWLKFAQVIRVEALAPFFLFEIFTPSYWSNYGAPIIWYVGGENYTLIFAMMALLGIVYALIRAQALVDRYCIGWSVSVVVYAMFFSRQIYQQSFAQMPFLGFVAISGTQAVFFLSESFKKRHKKVSLLVLMCVITSIALILSYQSLYRMYGTFFPGVDVAGESLKNLTASQERVFLYTHAQGNGISRYAQRYVGWPQGLEDFKQKEKDFKIRYLCVYPGDFLEKLARESPKEYEYIQKQYHFKEIGFEGDPQQSRPAYFILEKGKGEDLRNFLKSFSGQMQLRTIYRLFNRLFFFYTVKPTIG